MSYEWKPSRLWRAVDQDGDASDTLATRQALAEWREVTESSESCRFWGGSRIGSFNLRVPFHLLAFLLAGPTLLAIQGNQTTAPSEAQSKKTVTAVLAIEPIVLDGVLDEKVWQQATPATDFVQREPYQGQPATEHTEVRVAYDRQAIYFGMTAYDSQPDQLIINSLEQDFAHNNQDGLSLYIDTFDDDRNAFVFYVNPVGAKKEMQTIDEGRVTNVEWEDVWDVRARQNDDGWVAEIRIPFKSLRFPRNESQHWGINFGRRLRRKNERNDWSPIPRRFSGYDLSFAGDLLGIEGVSPGRNFKIKPFVTGQVSKFRDDDTDSIGDIGMDAKYGLGGLTLDVTLNTDFSQVEVDEQQINLTRFNLFFPEKRDFFIENAGIFVFGQTEERQSDSRRDFLPFFSRRIGLEAGTPLPILGGARLTGRAGPYSLGILDMQTRDSGLVPGRNFAVFRLKRNILAQSTVGVLWVDRESELPGDSNHVFGVDANFRLHDWSIASFLAGSRTPGLHRDREAGRVWVEWKNNFWEARSGYLDIGRNFDAKVGFVPRTGIRKWDSSFGWRPRPENPWVREFFPNLRVQYITDPNNRLLTRATEAEIALNFHDGATFSARRVLNFERLDDPFSLRGLPIEPGDFHFNDWRLSFTSNTAARLSGNVRYEQGDFWNGTRTGLDFGLSYRPGYHFGLTVRYKRDQLDLAAGQATSHLVTLRSNYAFSTRMFFDAFLQYNSDLRQISTNLRFNLIHRPLSDIFVVYNEQRDMFEGGQVDKALTVKITHMFSLF